MGTLLEIRFCSASPLPRLLFLLTSSSNALSSRPRLSPTDDDSHSLQRYRSYPYDPHAHLLFIPISTAILHEDEGLSIQSQYIFNINSFFYLLDTPKCLINRSVSTPHLPCCNLSLNVCHFSDPQLNARHSHDLSHNDHIPQNIIKRTITPIYPFFKSPFPSQLSWLVPTTRL